MRLIVILLCFFQFLFSYGQRKPIPNLPLTTLEEAGINRDSINLLDDFISNLPQNDFRGMTVIKDNKLVIEYYYTTFWRNQILDIRSAGKSITSLLVGVAMKEGLIRDLDQSVYSFFPIEKYPSIHKDLKEVKLKHLLDMSSGLDADSDRYETKGHAGKWSGTDEWVNYILSVPLVEKPNKNWVYADINAAIIGAIIEERSGMSLRDFAKEKVFDPLGIEQFYWYTNASNQTVAAGNLYLSTLDFAKLGVLVTNKGKWGNKQIVKAEYIERLLEHKVFDLSEVSSLAKNYGMFWYKAQQTYNNNNVEFLYASGNGGNYLVVIPDKNMVIALTSAAYGPGYGHKRSQTILKKLLSSLE
tara:strand:- start:3302 stop:4372 length:1071 start_codon:yes stop_codon:yes gene_type:complete